MKTTFQGAEKEPAVKCFALDRMMDDLMACYEFLFRLRGEILRGWAL